MPDDGVCCHPLSPVDSLSFSQGGPGERFPPPIPRFSLSPTPRGRREREFFPKGRVWEKKPMPTMALCRKERGKMLLSPFLSLSPVLRARVSERESPLSRPPGGQNGIRGLRATAQKGTNEHDDSVAGQGPGGTPSESGKHRPGHRAGCRGPGEDGACCRGTRERHPALHGHPQKANGARGRPPWGGKGVKRRNLSRKRRIKQRRQAIGPQWREAMEYERFVHSMAKFCTCEPPTRRPCDGVLAGGTCDLIECDSEQEVFEAE